MSVIVGRNGKIAISTAGVTYYDLGKVVDGSLDISSDVADATTNDSGGWKEGEYADAQGALSVTMKYDSSNTGQKALIDEMCTNRAKVYFRFRPAEAAGELQWIFLATLDSVGVSMSTGDVEELSISGASSGAVACSAQ